MLVFESGAIYLFDKGYIDFGSLQRIAASGAFFVTRAKDNLRFARQKISCRGQYNGALERLCRVFGAAQSEGKLSVSVAADSVFRCRAKALSGVFDRSHEISCPDGRQTFQDALGYRVVFQVEQGQSEYQALLRDESQRGETQICIAVTTYLLVAILHKELKLPGSFHGTLQILSVHPFEKIALHELLMNNEFRKAGGGDFNPMELFDL
jgi:hypothetical protein